MRAGPSYEMFQVALKASDKPGRVLTSDGVHMNPTGDRLMAKGILAAFGLTTEQLKKAEEGWPETPAK